jgi:hypothetical protein
MAQRTNAAPSEVEHLASQRADARRSGDYETADRLRADIESAGWKVIDEGFDFWLEPAQPEDIIIGGVVRYGSSSAVPSRLDQPDQARVTFVLVAEGGTDHVQPSLEALTTNAAGGIQVIVVGTDPRAELDLRLPATRPESELVRTAQPVGLASAWNIGIRRSLGSVIILLAPEVRLAEDVISMVEGALLDESVGIVGSAGLVSADLRRWQPAPPGEVDALDAELLAFRRSDTREGGELEERFVTPHYLAVWWSFVLRDQGEERPARRALALALPVEAPTAAVVPGRDRPARRDFYRIVDRFGRRTDLLRDALEPERRQ